MLSFVITILIGTNRPGSNTSKVAAQVSELYRAFNHPPKLIDLAQLPPEIFQASSYSARPQSFSPFSDAVLNSSGLVVILPEYNGSLPGVLKYFIDMLKFPESFERKPVCFIGLSAGMWGALRAVEHLQLIFGYRNAFIFPERVFLPKIHELLDESGRLKDTEIVQRLRNQAAGFMQFIEAMKSTKTSPAA
ncbi:MAG: NADPH-dependent oxidoreductase [Pedosphaera sp.]|nr:NADPH-dependent oxidoreductase [Pedosphaera sp.]